MRNRFEEQLERLHMELIGMGALCEDAISAAAEALLHGDKALAKAADEAERELDQKEREVETLCLKLLLQQQPVARDLREISAALKMISDLERIGDQAADIARSDGGAGTAGAGRAPYRGHGQGGDRHGDGQCGFLREAGSGAGPQRLRRR